MTASVIAVTNQKGGVGKTTTTVNLAAALVRLRKKVLLLDMDPQGNATVSCGIEKEALPSTVCDVLLGDTPMEKAIVYADEVGVYVCPSNADLTAAEVGLLDMADREYQLAAHLEGVKAHYDVVLIDCPPSLNMLTLNALIASDGALVPVQCEYFALEGLSDLVATIDQLNQRTDAEVSIMGVVRTMYDKRNRLSDDVSSELVAFFGTKVLQTIVPRNVRLAEAPSHGVSIFQYDKHSIGALAYLALGNELVKKKRI